MSDQVVVQAETSRGAMGNPEERIHIKKEARVAGVGDKEESDVAKDEKKDSEKPLLHGNEEEDSVAITMEIDKGKSLDTPTLPLPERKSKAEADDGEKGFSHIFPCARIKHAWSHSANLLEFFTRSICIIFSSVGWIVLVGGIPFFPIVQLVMGSIYLHDCPAEPKIPEYLIVAGVFGIILHGITAFTKCISKEKKRLYAEKRRRCLCLEAILRIFLLVWFIAGCFWVYTKYEPEYTVKEHHNYCNKALYLFTFWTFNIVFMIFVLIVTLSICCITFIAVGADSNHE